MSLQLEESTRYLNLVGGNQHYWLSGFPGGVNPEGSVETSSPGILVSWRAAAAAKVQRPLPDVTLRPPSLHCKYSAPFHTQTPDPLDTGSLALRLGCSACR